MQLTPHLKQNAFICLYNPLNIPITRRIKVPLYYTGIQEKAIVKKLDKENKIIPLSRDYSIDLEIDIPAKGYTWYIVE